MPAAVLGPGQAERQRVNVSHDRRDVQLAMICKKLDGVDAVPDRSGLVKYVKTLARSGRLANGRALELIAHSTGDRHLLDWRGWHIGADPAALVAFCEEVRPHVRAAGVGTIRLIGCRTATSEAGIAAMWKMKELLGVEVEGTRDLIDAADFDGAGCLAQVLVNVRQAKVETRVRLPPPTGSSNLLGPPTFRPTAIPPPNETGAPRIVVPYAALRANLIGWADTRAWWTLPGLLARPQLEVVFEVDGRRGVLAQVLFGWQYLRMFPTEAPRFAGLHPPPGLDDPPVFLEEAGRIYRLREGPDSLRSFLAADPAHATALARADAEG